MHINILSKIPMQASEEQIYNAIAVEYCFDNGYKIPPYQVHSLNPVDTKNIESYLENSSKYVYLLNRL